LRLFQGSGATPALDGIVAVQAGSSPNADDPDCSFYFPELHLGAWPTPSSFTNTCKGERLQKAQARLKSSARFCQEAHQWEHPGADERVRDGIDTSLRDMRLCYPFYWHCAIFCEVQASMARVRRGDGVGSANWLP